MGSAEYCQDHFLGGGATVIQSIGGFHSLRVIIQLLGGLLLEFVVCWWCSLDGSLRTRARRCRGRRVFSRGWGTLSTLSLEIETGEHRAGSFPKLGGLSNRRA